SWASAFFTNTWSQFHTIAVLSWPAYHLNSAPHNSFHWGGNFDSSHWRCKTVPGRRSQIGAMLKCHPPSQATRSGGVLIGFHPIAPDSESESVAGAGIDHGT